jgi:uncharacterized protein (TIGR02996 family)
MPPRPAFPEPAAPLPGEADILAAVVANPADDTAKLVYADWLEERDDPRGPYMREALAAARAGSTFVMPKFAPKPWLDLVGLTLLQNIHTAKLAAHADKILRLARPAVVVTSRRAAETKLPVGTSRFGGGPDMPADTGWPTLGEEPLAFLAQFNLAELSASLVCRELPSTGLLSVFSVWDEDEGNDDFADEESWRLFSFPDTSKLTRCLPPDNSFNSCRLEFRETLTVPDSRSPWGKELAVERGDDLRDAYQEHVAGWDLGHRVLGYPTPIQCDVLDKKTVRHLLTIDSDDNAGWMWGDGGSLYFTIAEADLRKHRFDRVRLEMQCG